MKEISVKHIALVWGVSILLLLFAMFCQNQNIGSPPAKKMSAKKNKQGDTCDWCNVVKTYSLNVNCHHYEESGDN